MNYYILPDCNGNLIYGVTFYIDGFTGEIEIIIGG